MNSLETARSLGTHMTSVWGLPELSEAQTSFLSDRLGALGPNGLDRQRYEVDYQSPDALKVRAELEKLRRALARIANISNSNNPEVKRAVLFALGPDDLDEPNKNRLWLQFSNQVLAEMPDSSEMYGEDFLCDLRPTKIAFDTYLAGAELPSLFVELYDADSFGSHNPQNDYTCPGIAFVSEVLDILGFPPKNYSTISKAISRYQDQFGHTYPPF